MTSLIYALLPFAFALSWICPNTFPKAIIVFPQIRHVYPRWTVPDCQSHKFPFSSTGSFLYRDRSL